MTQTTAPASRAEEAAKWLVEALESGNPLAPLPAGMAPRDAAEATQIAAVVLAETGQPACGVRILRQSGAPGVSGPVVEGRLLASGAMIALAMLRHPRASAAVIGVLGQALEPEATDPPVLARLHPALDLAATRFTAWPQDRHAQAADLGLLGLLVVGKARIAPSGPVSASIGAPGHRQRGAPVDLADCFAEAAAAARCFGGLPAGAFLVVAGLTPWCEPVADKPLAVRLTGLGKVAIRLA